MTQPTATSTTYTTIPISFADVISRSLHNLSNSLSGHRPWPELFSSGLFTRPDSFSSSLTRLRANFKYFRINYAIIVSLCAAVSLIGSPITLIVTALIYALWLLTYFFREDPLMLFGYQISDRTVLVVLIGVSLLGFWLNGAFWSLVLGVGFGVLVCGLHAVLRNVDELVFDESEDGTTGLIGSGSTGTKYGTVSGFDPCQGLIITLVRHTCFPLRSNFGRVTSKLAFNGVNIAAKTRQLFVDLVLSSSNKVNRGHLNIYDLPTSLSTYRRCTVFSSLDSKLSLVGGLVICI